MLEVADCPGAIIYLRFSQLILDHYVSALSDAAAEAALLLARSFPQLLRAGPGGSVSLDAEFVVDIGSGYGLTFLGHLLVHRLIPPRTVVYVTKEDRISREGVDKGDELLRLAKEAGVVLVLGHAGPPEHRIGNDGRVREVIVANADSVNERASAQVVKVVRGSMVSPERTATVAALQRNSDRSPPPHAHALSSLCSWNVP